MTPRRLLPMTIDVIAAIIERDGKVLVARRHSKDPLAGCWELPGGKLELGETHRQCLRRELEEELGVGCDIGDFVADHQHDYGDKSVHLYAYCASLLEGEPKLHDHDAMLWLDESQFEELTWAPADLPLLAAYHRLLQQRATLAYYQQFAEEYARDTRALSMTLSYSRFLEYVPAGGRILDLGCGSGRDSRYFQEMGFQVTAVDASENMARAASHWLGIPVKVMRAQDLNVTTSFEGIWCSASLLHCSRQEMPKLLQRLCQALVVEGVCFMSFKLGDGERVDERGRFYCDFNMDSFSRLMIAESGLEILNIWQEQQSLPEGVQDWLNVIVQRSR